MGVVFFSWLENIFGTEEKGIQAAEKLVFSATDFRSEFPYKLVSKRC